MARLIITADGLTKPLDHVKHSQFRNLLNMAECHIKGNTTNIREIDEGFDEGIFAEETSLDDLADGVLGPNPPRFSVRLVLYISSWSDPR